MKKAKYLIKFKDRLGNFQPTVTNSGTALSESNFFQMIQGIFKTEYPGDPNYREWPLYKKVHLQQARHERVQRLAFWLKNKRR